MRYEPDKEASRGVREAFGRVVKDMTPLERARVRESVMSRITVASRPLPARRRFGVRIAAAAAAFLVLTLGTSYAVAMSTPGTLLHPVKTALVRLLDPSAPESQSDPLPAGDSDAGGVISAPDTARPSPAEQSRSTAASNGTEAAELRSEMARLRSRSHSRETDDIQKGSSAGAGTLDERTRIGDGVGGTRTHSSISGDTSGSEVPGDQGATPDNGNGPGPVKSQSGPNGIQENLNGDPVDPNRHNGN